MDQNKAHYISVTGILVKDGKFLIVKRSPNEKAFPNLWTVPGGKIEKDDYETLPRDTSEHWYNVFENALKREVKEEVGLDIKNIKYLTSLAFIRSDGIRVIVPSLYTEDVEGKVELCQDLVDHAWVSIKDAKNYDLIEGIYEELEMLDKILKGQKVGEWKKDG